MHDAYEAIPILEKLPLQIESVTAYDGNLVVGTRQGHLLMYTVHPGTTRRWDVALLCSNKNFSRKPIVQVAVVPEHQIIVSLSDNIVSVHDLTVFNLPLLSTMSQTKGATTFDLDIKRHISLTGESVVTVRLVVAVRRKLQLYYWKSRQFHQLCEDITLPDIPKCLTWCGEAIAVASRSEYWLIKLTGEQKELFPTGKSQEALIIRLEGEDGQMALAHNKDTIFVDPEGNATCNTTLKWPEQPVAMAYDKPYIIAILPKNIEIRTPDPQMMVQNITVDKPRLLAVGRNSKGRNQVYVASTSHVWCLHVLPIHQQISQLLGEKQFALALKLVEVWEEEADAKLQMQQRIQHLQATYLFCNRNYQEALKLFFELETELPFVIGMYPDMVPEEYRMRLQYDYPLPSLTGTQLEEALQALIHFLLEVRHQLVGGKSSLGGEGSTSYSSNNKKSRNEKLQIIDTTLLKCYLQTNDTLVESLLRMRDSRVSVVEGERVLKKANKYPEVVLLLQTRSKHKEALQLMIRHAKRTDSPLFGHQYTVKYLQQLGPQYIDLIFEYGGWVLKSHPEDGLKIFVGDDTGESEQLPRPKVLNFLKKTEKNLVIPYLEHVIGEWRDVTPLLHNELIHQYRQIVTTPCRSSDPVNVEEDNYKKEEVRKKLLKFLNESEHYTAATILVHFPYESLHEERAVLLGRLGQHHQALSIYTHTLQDTKRALQYCQTHYTQDGSGSEVYLTLLKLLVCPPEGSNPLSAPNKQLPGETKDQTPQVEQVLHLLRNYLHCIDLGQALKILPDGVSINLLKPFIHASLNHADTVRRQKQIARGLSQSLKLQTTEELMAIQNRKITLSELTCCAVCKKRFTKHSAFAWYPNGDTVHFSCQDQR